MRGKIFEKRIVVLLFFCFFFLLALEKKNKEKKQNGENLFKSNAFTFCRKRKNNRIWKKIMKWKLKWLPWTVDHLARGSMKNAANCASTCELQDTWTSTFRTHIAVRGFYFRTTPGWGSFIENKPDCFCARLLWWSAEAINWALVVGPIVDLLLLLDDRDFFVHSNFFVLFENFLGRTGRERERESISASRNGVAWNEAWKYNYLSKDRYCSALVILG